MKKHVYLIESRYIYVSAYHNYITMNKYIYLRISEDHENLLSPLASN